jgi:pimeloyl-ACP methyl ester carboxylesterase
MIELRRRALQPKADALPAVIAGSRLVVIPGAGHTSTVEEPEAINQALLEFLGA